MLFYTQIKREFTAASWRRGQSYFREERVRDVKMDGNTVDAKVQGSEENVYQTQIIMARGTIQNSKCSCPAHREYETHCKHVAAVAIWIVEKGSLLRAGIISFEDGIDASGDEVQIRNAQKAANDTRLRKLLLSHPELAASRFSIRRDLQAGFVQGKDMMGRAFSIPVTMQEAGALLEHAQTEDSSQSNSKAIDGEAVLFIKGIFQAKALSALSVESAVRYKDPVTKSMQVNTLQYLAKQQDAGIWKTTHGVLLKVPTEAEMKDNETSFISRLDTTKVIYQGQQALENLAKFLQHPDRDRIVFDPNVNVELRTVPLKLSSMQIGEKDELTKARNLTFEFKSDEVTFSSEELSELAKYGRLSAQYVWKGDKIYKFETSLTRLHQFANRTGVAAQEGTDKPLAVDGFATIHDDREHPLHPIAAYRLSLELGVDKFVVDPSWTEFHEWRKNFEKKRLPTLPKIEYGFDLREYQTNGLKWLWSLHHRGLAALLADDMGLGKTHQALAYLSSIYSVPKAKRAGVPSSLVVAPTSVIAAWLQKLKKYPTGLKYHVYHGAGRKLPPNDVDIVLTTYGILHREPELRNREWHSVMLDEAQAIKNATTISARAARALKCKFRIAMTGTPVENQATDLWSLMEFLLPGYLGSLPRFKRLYGFGRELPSDVQTQALRRLISPFLLRRSKSQVLKELPEKTEEVVQCEMTAAQRKAYRMILTSAEAEKARANLSAGGKVDYANVLSVLTRLKQVCDHPRLADLTSGKIRKLETVNPFESGKWDTLNEIIDEATGSSLKVVIFTQYLGMMDLIGQFLKTKNIGYTELRGDTQDRGARLDRFQNDPSCQVFICSLLAGGLGIDLTSASVCIHYDRWWNPAKENQATDRLHRYGQTRGVQVFKLQVPGSVEDRIASIIQSKTELSGALIEESSTGLKVFSRTELLQLLQPLPDPDFDALPSEVDDLEESSVEGLPGFSVN